MNRTMKKYISTMMTVLIGSGLFAGTLNFTTMNAEAQITESFESGFGDWEGDWNYLDAYFAITRASSFSYDGLYSVELMTHGLPSPPYPQMTGWIERPVQVPSGVTRNVGLTFQLYSEGTDNAKNAVKEGRMTMKRDSELIDWCILNNLN